MPDGQVTTDLRELARAVAAALQQQPGWEADALEVRDTFDAHLDAALGEFEDAVALSGWLS